MPILGSLDGENGRTTEIDFRYKFKFSNFNISPEKIKDQPLKFFRREFFVTFGESEKYCIISSELK